MDITWDIFIAFFRDIFGGLIQGINDLGYRAIIFVYILPAFIALVIAIVAFFADGITYIFKSKYR